MDLVYWKILFWIISGLLSLSLLLVWLYYKITLKYRHGFVVRIHMTDNTVKHYRYDDSPPNDEVRISEKDSQGHDTSFTYKIKQDCIEQGNWGRYIDFDYHNMIPINPKKRNEGHFINELKEMFKMVGSFLDTDLYAKLMRNEKFEDFVRAMLWVMMILVSINLIVSGVGTFKAFQNSQSNDNTCTLTLDQQTWTTIFIASHIEPPKDMNSSVPPR